MLSVLIVEDDLDIAMLMKITLEKAGYDVDVANNGESGADLVEQKKYAIALLDIMLPGIDGYELFTYIKEYSIPAIFITAKGTISDKTKGFHLGADDYLVKPFELEELVLRVENVLRLHGMGADEIQVKDIVIHTANREVKKGERMVELTPKEYELLLVLVRNANIVLHRYALYEKVWGEDSEGNTRTLDIHIRRLRQKLGLENEIKTIYKVGYKMEIEK